MRNNRLLSVVMTVICIFLTGCSTAKPVTSTERPELRKNKLNTDYYKTDEKFWKMAYAEIPTVKYEEAISMDYRGTYVCLDMIGISGSELKSGLDTWKEVYVELAIPKKDGTYYSYQNSIVMSSNYMFKYGFDILCNIEEGDQIKLCLYNKSANIREAYVVGAKRIGKDTEFDKEKYQADAAAQLESEQEEKRLREEEKTRQETEQKTQSLQSETTETTARNYDELQRIFVALTTATSETGLQEMISQSGLCYTRQSYNGSPRSIAYGIAFTEGAARQKYADPGDHLDVSFNAVDGTFMYASYNKKGSSRIALFYNYGTYWDFREDAPGKYTGYYYYRAGDTSETGIMMEYSNGYSKKTAYHQVDSAERALP